MGILKKINHIDCFLVEQRNNNLLILKSKQQKVFNPLFTTGIICFAASMVFKANIDADIAAIPLAISTLILLSGVWLLSGTGQIVFDKTEGQIYCIYNHLGYLQKIYVHSLKSIDSVELNGSKLEMIKDNGERVLITRPSPGLDDINSLKQVIDLFLYK